VWARKYFGLKDIEYEDEFEDEDDVRWRSTDTRPGRSLISAKLFCKISLKIENARENASFLVGWLG
jgi:hypothetical protein